MIARTEGPVNKIIVICVAVAAFSVTVLWLRERSRSDSLRLVQTAASAHPSNPVVASNDVSAKPVPVHVNRTPLAQPNGLTPDNEIDPADRADLAEFVGGLSNIAPVSTEQQRAILEAKVRHRQIFVTALRDSGLDREGLSVAEREYAHQTLARALDDYRQGFLLDAKPVLDEEQFALLSNYEMTRFRKRLEELQIKINAK